MEDIQNAVAVAIEKVIATQLETTIAGSYDNYFGGDD